MISFKSIPNRTVLARIFYGVAVAFICYRWVNHMLLSQLVNPVLTYVNTDATYIALSYLGIPQLLTHHHSIALVFDLCFFAAALGAFLFPNRQYLPVLFTVLLGIYEVTGYTYLCFHKHNLTGMWICSLMFCVVDPRGFTPMFYLTRYYTLFVYGSAGFWKFFRGIWNLPGHFPVILKTDAMTYMVEHSSGLRYDVIAWLIVHPGLLDEVMILTCFFQISFLIGFFTRKLDWFFFLYAISFHLLAYFLVYASFFEFSVILITLLPLSFLYERSVRA